LNDSANFTKNRYCTRKALKKSCQSWQSKARLVIFVLARCLRAAGAGSHADRTGTLGEFSGAETVPRTVSGAQRTVREVGTSGEWLLAGFPSHSSGIEPRPVRCSTVGAEDLTRWISRRPGTHFEIQCSCVMDRRSARPDQMALVARFSISFLNSGSSRRISRSGSCLHQSVLE
jgi:hypothetical protein